MNTRRGHIANVTAKTAAKEQALAAMVDWSPSSLSVKPVKLENAFRVEEEFKSPPIVNRTILNPEAPEWPQPPAINSVYGIQPINPKVPIASGSSFDDRIKLQQQQSALQLQQNKIVEMLATNSEQEQTTSASLTNV